MNNYRIGDICEINPKIAIELNPDEQISFVPMNAISTVGEIDTSKTLSLDSIKNYTIFQERDILFAKITPCMENGKGCIADKPQKWLWGWKYRVYCAAAKTGTCHTKMALSFLVPEIFPVALPAAYDRKRWAEESPSKIFCKLRYSLSILIRTRAHRFPH